MENRKKIQHTRERLLEETIRQIEKCGPGKISLRQIAANCGVTHATVYKYFKDKQELIDSARPYIIAKLHPYLKRALRKAQAEEPFVVLCKAYVRYMVKHPQYHSLLYSGSSSSESSDLFGYIHTKDIDRYAPVTQDFMQRCGIPETEYPLMLPLLTSLLNGLIVLLNKKTIICEGDCTDLVYPLIFHQLKLFPQARE